jgi:hypothetical protein
MIEKTLNNPFTKNVVTVAQGPHVFQGNHPKVFIGPFGPSLVIAARCVIGLTDQHRDYEMQTDKEM